MDPGDGDGERVGKSRGGRPPAPEEVCRAEQLRVPASSSPDSGCSGRGGTDGGTVAVNRVDVGVFLFWHFLLSIS